MPLHIGVDGRPIGDEPPEPGRPLLFALGEPGSPARGLPLEVGIRARRVLDRAARPFAGERGARAVVAPALLDDARENPLGAGAQFVEDAVSTLISSALAANLGEWSDHDSRQAFATAFGLDPPNVSGRDEILGRPFTTLAAPGEDLLNEPLRRALVPIDDGGGLPPGFGDDFGPLDDLFERTCMLGVFESMHNLAVTFSRSPRESRNAHIDELSPNRGCGGEPIRIRGSDFGDDPSTYGLVLMFPAFEGGWTSVDVDDDDWSDTEINTVVPQGVGTGPVGFVQVSEGATAPLGTAVSEFVGAVGECLGPGAELHAASTFGQLGTFSSAAITETPTNVFRGGPPKIDYFLVNGAISAIVRPTGTIRLQWSAINAEAVTVSSAAGAPAVQPAVPPADAAAFRGDVLLPLDGDTAEWSGTYEIVAANDCGEATASVQVEVRSTLALVFAGGGSKGAFEVGVARCLYDVFGVQPDLLVGASVGALNAAKLAEGPAALPELEQLWRNMTGPADLFLIRAEINTILTQLGPGMRDILKTKPLEDVLGWSPAPTSMAVLNLNVAGRALGQFGSAMGSAVGMSTFGTITDILNTGLSIGLSIGKIVTAIQQLLLRPSLLLFDPVEALIQSDIDPAKVTASGIQLRVVVNGLRTGRVRYVDGSGAFVDGGPAPGLRRALTASAAIPLAFPPIPLPDGETYVDGGVLENTPIEAAVRAGADEVIAILPSLTALPHPAAAPTTLFPVATRAAELMLDGSSRRQLEPFRGWGVPVQVIAPRIELHNLLAVDPGLIRINMDYGYMCAYDETQGDDSVRSQYRLSSDAITALRKTIWHDEHRQHNVFPKGEWYSTLSNPWGSAEETRLIRADKRRLRDLVLARIALVGDRQSVPAAIDKAWLEWEGHSFDTLFPSPWQDWSSFPGELLLAETPPPPLP